MYLLDHAFVLRRVLVQAEEKWGKTTCWDSVTKLELLAKRACVNGVVQVRKVISMLQGIEFYCDSNFVGSSKLSISELGGKGRLGLACSTSSSSSLTCWMTG